MSEQPIANDRDDERRGDLERPSNPPEAVVNRDVRKAAVRTFVGIIAGFFAVVGVALLFWVVTGAGPLDEEQGFDPSAVGTSGDRQPREDTPGGFNPTPRPDSTEAELEFRGAGEPATGPTPPLSGLNDSRDAAVGTTIELRNVQVERAEGNTLLIRDGDRRFSVMTAGDMPTVRAGQRIDVTGTIEAGANETRIRASRIEVR